MDAGEEWRAKAGPWVRVSLPDDQELDVILTKWTRTPDGRWWAECEAILPARHEAADGTTKTMGAPTPISVHADDITPIPGEDYSAVPTDGAIAGRQWAVEKLHQYSEEHPNRRLHRRDCWQARTSHTRITTAEATQMAGAPLVDICDVCRPDRALRRLCRATLDVPLAASPVGEGPLAGGSPNERPGPVKRPLRPSPLYRYRCARRNGTATLSITPLNVVTSPAGPFRVARRCRYPRVPLVSSIRFLRGLRSCSERPPRLSGGAAACQATSRIHAVPLAGLPTLHHVMHSGVMRSREQPEARIPGGNHELHRRNRHQLDHRPR